MKHTLNSSPSKTAYSFSKGPRFHWEKTEKIDNINLSPNKNYTQNYRGARNSEKDSDLQKKKKKDY